MTLDGLTGMVRGLARQRAVLFLLEDAHWIDPTTADLMHRIVDLAGETPVLVLITLRPDYAPPWAGRPCQPAVAEPPDGRGHRADGKADGG
jgi:hypothetical protein